MKKPLVLRPTPRTTIHRIPARGSYDRALAYSILDEGLHASVGFVVDDQPYVIPMVYARDGDDIVLHGAAASRIMKAGAAGASVCVTVTLVDGIVLARSAFHHSMNYRSVVVLGRAAEVTELDGKRRALAALLEHVLPGRSSAARSPSENELLATRVLKLPVEEASVKVRSGGPIDDESDLAFATWAGHVPLRLSALEPVADDRHPPVGTLPPALRGYRRDRAFL
jgi:nitroimidazol reductase NimA-like FMN-containing flavoprotein (pyridoxamine 5'-phosphate oxidase superfamily)